MHRLKQAICFGSFILMIHRIKAQDSLDIYLGSITSLVGSTYDTGSSD